jgi:hypothetical protein
MDERAWEGVGATLVVALWWLQTSFPPELSFANKVFES